MCLNTFIEVKEEQWFLYILSVGFKGCKAVSCHSKIFEVLCL
jgi:hypothetical protein